MTAEMDALVQVGPDGAVDFRRIPVEPPQTGSVQVRVMAAGICGSDPHRVMRTYPQVPGHEFTGIVAELGPGVTGVTIGDRVAVAPLLPCGRCEYCIRGEYSICADYGFIGSRQQGGFAQYVNVPAQNLIPLPDQVSFREGAILEPLSVAVHAVKRGGLVLGESVVIFGAGPIGMLTALAARAAGADPVVLVDLKPAKLAVAKSLGLTCCVDATKGDVRASLASLTGPAGPDVVFEASGSQAGQRQCIEVVRSGGRVVLLGITHRDLVIPEHLAESILRKELDLRGSWAAYGLPYPGPDWAGALSLIARRAFDLEKMVGWAGSLREGPAVYQSLRQGTGDYVKVLFLPHGEA